MRPHFWSDSPDITDPLTVVLLGLGAPIGDERSIDVVL